MTVEAWLQACVFAALTVAAAIPLGAYMAAVFAGRPTILTRLLAPCERLIYRVCRIHPDEEMSWQRYAYATLALSASGIAAFYLTLRNQTRLPLNPQHFGDLSPDLAWNTAISFATTTDWQAYSGESTLGYFSQMAGCAYQGFLAAAIGLAIAVAFVRALTRSGDGGIGNFWVDVTRSWLYVLLPLAVGGSIAFVACGVPQNFSPYVDAATLDGAHQTTTWGPMASQEIIKLLGGNGGGFVGANSTSPNENPTPAANLLQLFATLLIPVALVFAFGRMIGDRRHARAIFATMATLVVLAIVLASLTEAGNMEGKETRFGSAGAGLSVAVATSATTGSANATYDSLEPLTGLVAMVNLQLGEVAFGGVGSGLTGMLILVVLTVFVTGLMVGRTPEYLGKKIERREITLVMIAVLLFPIAVLVPAAVASVVPAGTSAVGNAGPHGFSEIAYAFASVTSSNGSSFGGLSVNSLFYNVATGIAMLAGRYGIAVPTLALAGALALKTTNTAARCAGAIDTGSALFAMLLLAVVVIVGALTFLPADGLGPIADQLTAAAGRHF